MTDPADFDRTVEAYEQFWETVPKLDVPLDGLADPRKCTDAIQRISDHIGQRPRQPPVLPRLKAATAGVLLDKVLTRLPGRRAPVINTTIGFALTDGANHGRA